MKCTHTSKHKHTLSHKKPQRKACYTHMLFKYHLAKLSTENSRSLSDLSQLTLGKRWDTL